MVDWSMGVADPSRAFAAGNDYVNKLYDTQAQKRAGAKIVSGDYRGAAGDLASRGDVRGATTLSAQAVNADAGAQYAGGDVRGAAGTLARGGDLQGADTLTQHAQADADRQATTFQKQHDYLQRAVPVLTAVLQKGGAQALAQAFDQIAPELESIGTPKEQIEKLRQSFASNPEQTLQVLGATAAKKFTYQKVGEDLFVFDEQGNKVQEFKGSKAPPAGYDNGPAGPDGKPTLVPITGGPQDPDVQHARALDNRTTIVNNPTQPVGGADSEFNDEEADFLGQQLASGDRSVLQNLGRGQQGAKNVVKVRRAAIKALTAQGLNGKDAAASVAEFMGLQAGERTLGTRGAAIKLAADEAETFATQALDASAAVPRGNFVPMNQLLQYTEGQVSDPKLKKLLVATQALINARARAISPTGIPRVEDQAEGRRLLANADGPGAYKAAVQQMLLEVRTAKAAPANVKSDMNTDFTGRPGQTPPAPTTPRVREFDPATGKLKP